MKNFNKKKNQAIALIHFAAKELCIDDDTRRTIMLNLIGKNSTKNMTHQERKAVIDHFKALGFQYKPKKRLSIKDQPANFHDETLHPYFLKLETLLKNSGKSWNYALGIAQRMFNDIARLEWLKPEQLKKIIAALNYAA